MNFPQGLISIDKKALINYHACRCENIAIIIIGVRPTMLIQICSKNDLRSQYLDIESQILLKKSDAYFSICDFVGILFIPIKLVSSAALIAPAP